MHMCTLCICFYEEQLPEKTYKQTHTHKKEKQQNKKATCTSTEKLDNSFGKKQKCNGTELTISWTIPKDIQKESFIYSRWL